MMLFFKVFFTEFIAEMGDITVGLNQERIGGIPCVELEHPVFFIECDRHGDSSV